MIIGKFHILLLHLPIGILFLAIALEWANYFNWQKVKQEVFIFTYGLGAASAILACITGNVLANGYDYATMDTSNHFWAGIVTAILASLVFFISLKGHHFQKWISLAVGVSLAVTGHLGGSLTHGEGFLFPPNSEEGEELVASFEIDNIEEAELYTDIISPILNAKCVQCHGPNKIKGKLRMDSPEHIMAGGKSRKDILGESSEMLRRVDLPISNDKHMPPKQKTQLTEKEVNLIEWWIDEGSSFEGSLYSMANYEEMVPVIEEIIAESGDVNANMANIPAYLPEAELEPPSEYAIQNLRSHDIVVLEAGEGSNFLDINFVNVKTISEEVWSQIKLISSNISRLKLSDIDVGSEQLKDIGQMPNLVTLYLDKCGVSDQDLSALSSLEHLNYLNLSGNEVSNSGLQDLEDLPMLKQLYAFESNVSLDTLANGANVVKGGFTLETLETDTIRFAL